LVHPAATVILKQFVHTAATVILEVKTDNKVLILCEVWGSESSFAED
jgi:hypothetical protein